MESWRNLENGIDIECEHCRNQQTQNGDAAVAEEAGVDQPGEIFNVVNRGEFRNVADHRGTDAEIEQPIIAGDGKDQSPDTGSGIAQFVQDDGIEQNAHDDIDAQGEPTGADILDDLPLVDTHAMKLWRKLWTQLMASMRHFPAVCARWRCSASVDDPLKWLARPHPRRRRFVVQLPPLQG